MNPLKRFARLLACIAALAVVAAPTLAVPVAAKSVPWLYKNSDVPQDKEWKFGKLRNGLRYAVRKNRVPPGQVSIRIRVDAGSLYEREGEEGYAHLLEHLLFRQSKYLGDGQAIPTWQRLGASFGNDTNAETTTTQTVYKLDLPNATPEALEESFKLLSGMVTAPTLSEDNIRTELPIVLAEMRERGGAAQRVQDTTRRVFYKGQPLAERAPIGTVESLQGATQESVRAFYKRWYRPENVVLIVAGDADTEELAALVRKWFSDWKVRGRPASAPSFGDPRAPADADPANPVGETHVMVEPDLPRSVSYAILRPWRQVNDTIEYNQGLMVDALAQALINRRLESKARAGGSFLVGGVSQDDVSRSVDATFVSVTPLTDDWQAALRDVRAVIADALVNPPTEEEIAREVAEIEVAFQVPVEQRRLLPGSRIADDLVTALDIRETVAAPEDVLEIYRSSIPLFTPERVLEHTRALFRGDVTRAIFITPKTGEGDSRALRQALLAPVKPDGSVRLADSTPIRFDDMPPIGEPGKIASILPTGLLSIEQIDFENGVKVLMWPVREEPGRVAVKVRFGGGYRSFGPDDAPYIALGEMALVGAGVGNLGQEELDRIATGRKMGFDFDIDDASFEFSADTRPSDLADQLYLFAAKFAMPRWDENPVLRAKAAAELQYEAYSTSPQGVLSRDLKYLQRDRDPRFETPTPAEVAQATPEGFRRVWQRALDYGPIEVQVYGDFDRDEAIAALQRTFGALAPRKPLPEGTAPASLGFPEPSDKPVVLTHRGDANQAAAVISWPTGGGSPGISEARQLEILTQLFTNRLMLAMREKMGASYAPQVYSNWPVDLDSGGSITAMAQLAPSAVPTFFATADEIANDLITNPPDADELARVTEPLRQQVTRAATGSAFFMYELRGATWDPSRIASIRTILPDYTQTTPERMQALARQYLGADRSWRLAVLPESQAGKVTTAVR
ncbi:MAG: insulinase family protein [Novosphingobium sp.]|nr:insulinase family protein [Novosphingobium sp.]